VTSAIFVFFLLRQFGFLALKDFKISWLSIILAYFDEGYSRNESGVPNLINYLFIKK
jgi:hypothetical protein